MGVVSCIPVFGFFLYAKRGWREQGELEAAIFQTLAMLDREHGDMINLFVFYSSGWTAGTLPACYITQNDIPSNTGSSRGAERKSLLFHCYTNDKSIWLHCCLHTIAILLWKNKLHNLALCRSEILIVISMCTSGIMQCHCLSWLLAPLEKISKKC